MRLIDADKLKPEYILPSTTATTPCYYYVSKKQIDNAPTVDAVEVIRCKKCVCFRTDEKGITYCASMGVEMQPNDFCSYGEVKNETNS